MRACNQQQRSPHEELGPALRLELRAGLVAQLVRVRCVARAHAADAQDLAAVGRRDETAEVELAIGALVRIAWWVGGWVLVKW